MNIEWNTFRIWNGSQDNAFEELCCQLASCESYPAESHFTRKGAPDAGVECYWKLTSGEECAWQAKFFTNVPTTQQWQQIDESVKTALQKHSSLVRYTVCLPLNRQDPRKEEESWFQDKWDERVKKWKTWASDRKMAVEFQYWGESEMFSKLTHSDHSGRLYFWFNKEYLGQNWYQNALEKALANAGARYTPELHINLPINQVFDGLGRTPDFFSRLGGLTGEVKKKWKAAVRGVSREAVPSFHVLESTMNQLLAIWQEFPQHGVGFINIKKASEVCKEAGKTVSSCSSGLRELKRQFEKAEKDQEKSSVTKAGSRREQVSYSQHLLGNLHDALYHFNAFTWSREALLANQPNLLVVGDAGTGKTHLFCDVANRRIQKGLPTVVLLGGHFEDSEPWSQIGKELRLTCRNEEELLGALDASGQARDSRVLILIDALNEGEGKTLWKKRLGGILTTLARYPYVGIAVSVRSSYEGVVIPNDTGQHGFIREVHQGFSDHEYDATGQFFDHFNIQRPAIPVLVPEFKNPLFLKIFCKGLSNRGLTIVPEGLDGITSVFEFFVDSINDKLAGPDQVNFDAKAKYVQKAVSKLIEEMARTGKNWLARDTARSIIETILHREGHTKSLFNGLISEGLLAEDITYLGQSAGTEDVIRFSYERFSDHLIASFLLEKHLDAKNPSSSFSAGQPLHEFVKEEAVTWVSRGLIEAFSVQVPERTGKELIEVVPAIKTFQPVQESFLDSLLWRKPANIGDAALKYMNDTIVRTTHFHDRLVDTLLTLVPKPDHPFNATFLHKNLKRQALAQRDAWWSVFLHRHYGSNSAVDRLIDWAWSKQNRSHVADQAIHLFAIALAWFLTSSNRFVRDKATKALVTLLEDRLSVFNTLLKDFQDVNDPYVLERLFAAAYGCALRSNDDDGIRELAQTTFDEVFSKGTPPPHILLRDYARGVIEVALHRNLRVKIAVRKIRPSYKSKWIPPSATKEELEHKYYPKDWKTDRGYGDIWNSVMGFGDFARYIIGTNSDRFDWTNQRLGQKKQPSRKNLYDKFTKSLGFKAKKALTDHVAARNVLEIYRRMGKDSGAELARYSEQDLENHVTSLEQQLRDLLTKPQVRRFDEIVLPYLKNPHADEFAFDLSIAQRWIFERVIQLGWTPKLFEEFDSSIRGGSRNTDKPERIGKKYQWIAYYEFLAKVADNFEFRGDMGLKEPQPYQGPWQDYWRDIDPSFVVPVTDNEPWKKDTSWWVPQLHDWQVDLDDVSWLKHLQDIPSIESLVRVQSPRNGTSWLTLHGFFSKMQPPPHDEEDFESQRRNWYVILKSYLVRKRDMKAVFSWATKQNFMGRWMPESSELTKVFLAEYPWGPSFQYKNVPYFNHSGWTRGDGRKGTIPKPVLVTNDEYFWERGYDCSMKDSVRVSLPAKLFVDGMKLRWNGYPGMFVAPDEEVVFQDPSVSEKGPSVLLANEKSFVSFLKEKEYEIFWTVLAEKNLIGGGHSAEAWKGRLEINGAYRIDSGKLVGKIKATFKSPDSK